MYLTGITISNASSNPSQLRNSLWQQFRQQIVKVAKQYKRRIAISCSSQTSIQQFLLLVLLRAETERLSCLLFLQFPSCQSINCAFGCESPVLDGALNPCSMSFLTMTLKALHKLLSRRKLGFPK